MGFGRDQKFKKVVKDVFPKDPSNSELQSHNVGKLLFYAGTNADQLQKIGKYLEDKVIRCLKRQRFGHLMVCLKTFIELIKSTTHLALFGSNVLNVVKLLIQKQHSVEIRSLATSTFERYLDTIEDTSKLEWETYIDTFLEMCKTNQQKDTEKIRVIGLKGLGSFILNMQDASSFIAKYVQPGSNNNVVVILLENMMFEGKGNEQEESISELANKKLKDLATKANNINVRQLLISAFKHISEKKLWASELALNCTNSIAYSMKPHSYESISCLVQHLKEVKDNKTKSDVIKVLISIIKGPISPILEVLNPLINELIKSSTSEEKDSNILQDNIISCIEISVKTLKKVDITQKVEALHFILQEYEKSKTKESHFLLIKSVHSISKHLNLDSKNISKFVNVVYKILQVCLSKERGYSKIRSFAQRTLLVFLEDGNLLKANEENSNLFLNSSQIKMDVVIRMNLFHQSEIQDNEPLNFYLIFQILHKMLSYNKSSEMIQTVPMIFSLQNNAKNKSKTVARCIISIVGAYFFSVSKLLVNLKLETYCQQVFEEIQKAGEQDPYFSLTKDFDLKLNEEFFKEQDIKNDKDSDLSVSFKKQNIIEILSQINSLKEFNNLTEILSSKFQPSQESLIEEDISIKLDESRLFSVVSNNDGNNQNNNIDQNKEVQITTKNLKELDDKDEFYPANNYTTLLNLNKNSLFQEINSFVEQTDIKNISINKKSIKSKTILNIQFPSSAYIL